MYIILIFKLLSVWYASCIFCYDLKNINDNTMKLIQFKMIFRGWARNKVYTVISIFSLIVGLTCSILMSGFVVNEYRIAHALPNSDRWYALRETSVFYGSTELEVFGGGQGSLALQLKERYPEVGDYCVFHYCYTQLIDKGKPEELSGYYEVQPDFARIFQPKVIEGDLEQTLSRPGEIAVTRSFALKRFGKENVVGESLTLNVNQTVRLTNGMVYNKMGEKIYVITAVLDDSRRSFFNYNLLAGLPKAEIATNLKGWIGAYYTFVGLNEGVEAKSIGEKIEADTTFQTNSKLKFVPMDQVYFSSDADPEGLILSRDPSFLYIGISIALAVLLIACFNYINISMTRTLQRLRNTGQQMAFGASKQQMRTQLMVETALQVFFSVGIAFILIYQLLPQFNGLFGARLFFSDFFTGATPWILAGLLGLVIIIPTLYIFSRLGESQLSRILKQEYGKRSRLITGMVVAQFAISIVLLIFVVNVQRQMNFVAHNRPGAERIITIDADGMMDENLGAVFHERLFSIPEIEDVAWGSAFVDAMISVNGKNMNIVNADENYFRLFNLQFLEGGPFTATSPGNYVVVNEAMVEKWDIKSPVGNSFQFNGQEYVICGVVHNYIIDDLTRAIEPLMITSEEPYTTVVKISAENRSAAVAKMMALWKEIAPDEQPFEWETLADSFRNLHQEQQKTFNLVFVFSWISLILTCLGLFGLAWYSVENRMKEIALRKVSGATEVQVMEVLCSRFMKWILIAFLMALPVAIYFTFQWIKQFVYQQQMTVWTYVGVGVFVFMLGVLTVVWQSWRAAVRNPVETLKSE